jgi:hypothetical protein
VWRFFAVGLVLIVTAGVGRAQPRADCQSPQRPALGVSVGRSSPYLEFDRAAIDAPISESISVRSGLYLAARGDLPIAGAWRARVEGSAANWRVERRSYSTDLNNHELTASDTAGRMEARQIIGLVGRQGGRAPVCGYVLAGGGIYSLDYRGTNLRRPGLALTAGVEFPAGGRGVVQLDMQLHVIDTPGRSLVSTSKVLAASLSAGWAFRF